MKKFVYKPLDSAIAFLLAIVMQVVLMLCFLVLAATLAGLLGLNMNEMITSHFGTIMMIVIAEGAFALTVVSVSLLKGYQPIKSVKWHKGLSAKNALLSVAIALVALFGFLGLANMVDLLIAAIGYPLKVNLPLPLDNGWWLALSLLLLAVLPAVMEELLFRGMILNGFLPLGKNKAILLSALLFMLVHGNIQQTFYQFVFGLVLGIVMVKTSSLWAPIVVHFVNNAVVVIWQFLTQNQTETALAEFAWIDLLWAVGTAAIATLVLFYLLKALKRQMDTKRKQFVVDEASGNLVLESDLIREEPIGLSFDENFGIKVHTMEEEQNVCDALEEGTHSPIALTYSAKVLLMIGIGLSVLIWLSDLATGLLS